MVVESVSATDLIAAPADAVHAVLADPSRYAAIDGTGLVRGVADPVPLTRPGQVFRLAMVRPGRPDDGFETLNEVLVCDAPHTLAWRASLLDPASGRPTGDVGTWRCDLVEVAPGTTAVTLTYDWSVAEPARSDRAQEAPLATAQLADALTRVAALVAA